MRLFTQLTTLVFFLLSFTIQAQDSYDLTIESNESTVTAGTTYRFYVEMDNPTDRISAVFGHNLLPLTISAPAGVFNSAFNASWSASGINELFLPSFPDMAADSYATIGLEGPAGSSGIDGSADPSLVQDTSQPLAPFFTDNESANVEINTVVGAAVYLLNTATNGLPGDDLRVLIMQITTTGSLSGTLNYQVFPLDDGANAFNVTSNFSEGGGGEVEGCTIELACNFNPLATVNDGSCDFTSCLTFGCDNVDACNYDPEVHFGDDSCIYANAPYGCDGECVTDTDGDGVCDVNETYGCTDDSACNYDNTASEDDATCTYATAPYDCFGLCVNDVDANGICDEFEGPGCTDMAACNFNPNATIDDGSCVGDAYGLDVDVVMTHTEGVLAGQTTYRLYVTTPHTDDFLSAVYGDVAYNLNISSSTSFYQHAFGEFLGSSMNPGFYSTFPELEYDSWVTIGLDEGPGEGEEAPTLSPSFPFTEFEDGGNLEINDVNGGAWYVSNTLTTANAFSDENQRILVAQLTTDGTPSGAIWVQMFNHGVSADETRLELTFDGTTGTLAPSCGCTDMTACNYDASASDDDGTCIGIADGACDCDGNVLDECGTCGGDGIADGTCDCDGNVLDALGVCGGTCSSDADGNGVCDNTEIFGCMDTTACNYDMAATQDDGSCGVLDACGVCLGDDSSCTGCTDMDACNYDSTATIDDGTNCDFADEFLDCAGNCLNDSNGDGVCDEQELEGCTVEMACNFNPLATINDGSCDFTSCLAIGCMDIDACNYDPEADYEDGTCVYALAPYDCEGVCVTDTDGDGVCDVDETFGCTDTTACNYDMAATQDDGSCTFDDALGVCGGPCASDANGNGVCDDAEVSGCMDATACNYDVNATNDDGSCTFDDALGVCGGSCTSDADGNGVCDDAEVLGCMDATACNYDMNATNDDGSCGVLDACGVCLGDDSSCSGCTDMTACNYDPTATLDDGTNCDFADEFLDCAGDCLNDNDGDGVCDELEVAGCTDEGACNYDATATDSDDSCDYSCLGCTDMDATNYDADAIMDDGSCCYLVLSLSGTDADCFGGEGVITATVTGAEGTVTYTLGMESNETGEFTVIAGTYTVTAADVNDNMCTSTMEVFVGEGTEIIVDASATDETAAELGVGTATATGGSGDYTFVWYDSDLNEVDASALAAGDYTVQATDSNDCVGGAGVTINFNGIYDIDPLAFGLFPNPTTGAITLQVSTEMYDVNMQVFDATGRVVFTQSNLIVQGSISLDFSNLSTGTYSMMLSNNNGVSVRRLSIQH